MYYAFQRGKDGDHFVPVKGRPVKIEGFEEFEFFYYERNGIYHIVEAKTSLGLGSFKRLGQAKKIAEEVLKSIGAERLREQIEKKVAENGISPRYEEVEK